MIVLLDQDGVLADFEGGFVNAWSNTFGNIPAIPIDARRNFRVRDDYPPHLQRDVIELYSSPGFFRNLPPVRGAIESAHEMLTIGIDVRICTSAIDEYENCVLEKYEWVERHLGRNFTQRIVLTKDKTIVAGDWLIDDKPAVTGSCLPVWKHVLFDAPYNRSVTDRPRVTWENWRSVIMPSVLSHDSQMKTKNGLEIE